MKTTAWCRSDYWAANFSRTHSDSLTPLTAHRLSAYVWTTRHQSNSLGCEVVLRSKPFAGLIVLRLRVDVCWPYCCVQLTHQCTAPQLICYYTACLPPSCPRLHDLRRGPGAPRRQLLRRHRDLGPHCRWRYPGVACCVPCRRCWRLCVGLMCHYASELRRRGE